MKTSRQMYLKELCNMSPYNVWSDLTIDEIESIRSAAIRELYKSDDCENDWFMDYLTFEECFNLEGELVEYA